VVGQVLGYVAFAAEWTAENLERVGDEYLSSRAAKGPNSLIELLAEQLGDEEQAHALLDESADRLARGDVTALIVVDDIPKELRRLVDWVNSNATLSCSPSRSTAPRGGPLRKDNFRRRARLPAVAAAGLDGLRVHDLRHSHVALLIAQGAHPKVIEIRLGHASISITLDRYGHLFDGLNEAAADALDDAYGDSVGFL
jgi:integrase